MDCFDRPRGLPSVSEDCLIYLSVNTLEKIYVNSKLDGTLANPGGYTNNDLMLRIGWDPHAEDRHYVGVIDEVAIYDRALTPDEIVQNQNASLGITSVDPAGKLSSTWGEIKAGY